MSDNIQIIPDKIQIQSIRLLGGNIKTPPEVESSKIASFSVKYGITDELNFRERIFKFIVSILIEALDESDNELGSSAEYNIEYVFHVENLDYYVTNLDKEKKTIYFHPTLTHTLVNLVYSTARGIVLSRTQGTLMEGVILPLVDTKSLVQSLEENKMQSTEASVK